MTWRASLCCGLGLFSLVACGETSDSEVGARSYETHCASCHGAEGMGDGPAGPALGATDLTSAQVAALTDAEIHDRVRNGGQKMPAIPAVTDEQLTEVIRHVRSLRSAQ